MVRQQHTSRRTRLSWHARKDERGAMTLEVAILFPVVLLIIFGGIQAALYFHARGVALSAAQQGVRVAKAENGTAGAGSATARTFVNQAGGSDVLTGLDVGSSRNADRASVTVSGRPLSVLPGVPNFRVTQSAHGPVEQFTAPGGVAP